MKKSLLLLLIPLMLSGCQKENNNEQTQGTTCTTKKFQNNYTYVYTTKEECVSKGNEAFMTIYENKDDSIFTYGCEQITDECGITWYGVYFNRWSENGGDEVTKVYY